MRTRAKTTHCSGLRRNFGLGSSAGCSKESFGGLASTYKSKQIKRLATKLKKVDQRKLSVKKTSSKPAKRIASANHRTRLNLSRIFDFRSLPGSAADNN